MEKCYTIGILGAPINSENLGCQALTYSLLNLLNEIEKRKKIDFEYVIFEWYPNSEKNKIICNQLRIRSSKIISVKYGCIQDVPHSILHFKDNIIMKRMIKSCDLLLDLTEGDSFTDIYGSHRFNHLTSIKEYIEKNKSLILGSQTYGPFKDPLNEKKAVDIMKNATAIFSRDYISSDYVKRISNVNAINTCDLAFRLPYESHSIERTGELKRIGLNISGLLVSDKKEGTDTKFSLKSNYDDFIIRILDYLISKDYEIHLIGHVGADYIVNRMLKEKYPSVSLAPEFDNPMDAKSYISSMDLFIGSRMHATIAALTSNTPVIPVAYSRKFAGVFESVGYPYMINLQLEDTDHAVLDLIDRIEDYQDTRFATEKAYRLALKANDECLEAYEKVIGELLEKQ